MTASAVRAENRKIASEKHVLQAVSTNKICLSAFDNKPHILNEGIKPPAFGHYELDHCRVEDFSWDGDEVEWDYKNVKNYAQLLRDSSPKWNHNNSFVVPDTTISENPEEWETPDPGFAMTSIINEDDIDSDDVEDFDATTSSSSSSPNPVVVIMKKKPALKVARRQ